MMKKYKRKGGILIYILGVITLLSLVVSEFLVEVADEIRYRSQVTGKDDLKVVAYSALQYSFGVISEIGQKEKGLHSPAQGWGNPLSELPVTYFDRDYVVTVKVRDETGKIGLTRINDEIWNRGFQSLGLSLSEESQLREALRNWLSQTPNLMYSDQALPKATSSKPEDINKKEENKKEPTKASVGRQVTSFRELSTSKDAAQLLFDEEGQPTATYYKLKNRFSLYNKQPININSVAPELEDLFSDLGILIDPANPIKSFDELGVDAGQAFNDIGIGFSASVLDIDVEVARASVKYYINAIVQVSVPKPAGVSEEAAQQEQGREDIKPLSFTILALTQGRSTIR